MISDTLKQAVLAYADAHCDADGLAPTALEGVTLARAYEPSVEMRGIYRPLLCLVLQGAKQAVAGGQSLAFTEGRWLVVNVDVPVVGRIVEASRHRPYLALALDLDMAVMRELIGEIAAAPISASPDGPRALGGDLDEAILDCAARLMRLLAHPEAIPVLRDGVVREMHYWLLSGDHGGWLRRLAMPGGHAQRVGRAVATLRAGFAEPIRVERLAAIAGMSLSSFHQHFRAVTSLTPLQFQKQLRLLEARRILRAGEANATGAALAVGYESVSQFNREYARMFGAPPRRDIAAAA